MKIVKRLMALTLSMGLVASMFTGAYAAQAPATLTVDAAYDQYVKNNTDLVVLERKIIMAETELRMAKANVSFYETKTWSSGSERQANALKAYLTPVQKENALASLKRQQASSLKQIKIDVMSAFQGIIKKQSEISDKAMDLTQLEKDLVIKQSEFKLGKLTQLDLRKAETKRNEAQQNLKKANNDLEILFMNLNHLMGKELSLRYTVVLGQTAVPEFKVADLAGLIKTNQETSDSVLSQKESIVEKDLEIKTLKTYGLSDVYNDASAQTDLRDKELELEKAKKNMIYYTSTVAFNIENDYSSLQDAYTDIKVLDIDLAAAKEDLKIAESRFKVGKITQNALDLAKDTVTKTERALELSKLNYSLTVETFKKNYGL